jgi:hypothetical protein
MNDNLTDEDFAALGAATFAVLDEEEAAEDAQKKKA